MAPENFLFEPKTQERKNITENFAPSESFFQYTKY